MSFTRVRVLVAAVAIGGALALSGCTTFSDIFGSDRPVRDEDTGAVIEGNESADVFALRVGDCINSSELDGEITSIPVVPCDEPHETEVYVSHQMDDGEFPGDDAVQSEAEDVCIDEFTDFVGLTYQESALEVFWMYPSQESWAQGDHEILCLLGDTEKVTGTLEGAGR